MGTWHFDFGMLRQIAQGTFFLSCLMTYFSASSGSTGAHWILLVKVLCLLAGDVLDSSRSGACRMTALQASQLASLAAQSNSNSWRAVTDARYTQ